MKLCHSLACLGREKKPILLAAGFFDGVHRGHQEVIRQVMRAAARRGAHAWIMTFDIHPLKLLQPEAAPPLLTATAHKARLLEKLGADGCLILPFTRSFALMEPEKFIVQLTRSAPNLRGMAVGNNWTFGRRGCGTPALLKKLGALRGFDVRIVRQVRWRGGVISSTRIRRALADGKLADAAAMLGRDFSVAGTVVTGRGFGRRLGIPTANISPHNEVLPEAGVYAVRAVLGGKFFNGVANVGQRPTFGKNEVISKLALKPTPPLGHPSKGGDLAASAATGYDPLHRRGGVSRGGSEASFETGSNNTAAAGLLEVHLFDICENLYHREMEVFFLKRMRPERKFAAVSALKRQIMRDVEQARKILENLALQKNGLRYNALQQ